MLALRSRSGRLALAATVGASSMAFLDATVVNVAVPHIGRDFHSHVSSLQWVLNGYMLALASLILLGGALGDRLGRRRIFEIGTVWFAVASLLCGAAPNIGFLIGARVLQGVGGALLTPGSLAILQASFQESDRAAAVGAWSGLGGVAGAIGPFVGGFLVDGPGWRWAFLLNLPVAALVVTLSRIAIPETRDEHASGHLDLRGAVLGALVLAVSTWALTEAGPRGWTDPAVIGAGAFSIAAAVVFVHHLLTRPDPLVPPALFRNRTFTVVNLATAVLYGSIGITFFFIAYELQVAAGWSALRAGVALLPTTIMMLLLSSRSGALAQKIGPRTQLTVGPILTAGGLLLLTRIGPHTSWLIDVAPGAAVVGLGLVTFVAPLTATVMAAADADHVSVASGVNNAISRAAGLSALAVIPVVSGLSRAAGPAHVTHAFRVGMVIAAVGATLAAPLSFVGLEARIGTRVRGWRIIRKVNCAVDGTLLQPDPARCPQPIIAAGS